MKKKTKKLQLTKETVQKLETNDYKLVLGGTSASWFYFCRPTHGYTEWCI
jgi:hypothetical protein